MKRLQSILLKAKSSSFYLWILNHLLWRFIPFNHHHRVTIQSVADNNISVRLPYRKSNQNHLKGMHACALATLCEYACGIGLMTRLDPTLFRIILKEIRVDYLTQARSTVYATFELDEHELEQDIIIPLNEKGSVVKQFSIEAYDSTGKKVCVGEITWQLKRWDRVVKKNSI
jgi:acyl-coenzyme A thioesterase PaaI-like protein